MNQVYCIRTYDYDLKSDRFFIHPGNKNFSTVLGGIHPDHIIIHEILLTGEHGRRRIPLLHNCGCSSLQQAGVRHHRDHDVSPRGIVQGILACYLRIPPDEVRILTHESGKPYLEVGKGPDIHFSLSYSGDRMILACLQGREVGVDIEQIDEKIQIMKIAERFFHQRETNHLLLLGKEQMIAQFFSLWTQKEAILKAGGYGLSIPLQEIRIPCPVTETAYLLEVKEKTYGCRNLPVSDTFSRAIAWETKTVQEDMYDRK